MEDNNKNIYVVSFKINENGIRVWDKPIRKDKYNRKQKLNKINKLNNE